MSRKLSITLISSAGIALALVFTPTGRVASQTIRQVFVTNFPDVQQVTGTVSVEGPVRLSELASFEDLIVPPVQPDDTTRLVSAGTLVTSGFTNVVLSLHGLVKGSVKREGEVGAILIPDQEEIQVAFDELGLFHFDMRVSSQRVSSRTPYFASTQPSHSIGFQAYRIYLYNTTDKTVTVNLFAYLTG